MIAPERDRAYDALYEGVEEQRKKYLKTQWTRLPKTLAQAMKRIEALQQAIWWMLSDLSGAERSSRGNRAERYHFEHLLTQRWDANDGRANTPPDPNCDICMRYEEARRG